jgi:hypothetical protein
MYYEVALRALRDLKKLLTIIIGGVKCARILIVGPWCAPMPLINLNVAKVL